LRCLVDRGADWLEGIGAGQAVKKRQQLSGTIQGRLSLQGAPLIGDG
jgi:hypothetical protein